mmetsp:Transcript_108218/g.161910  ORF Transcript_108218/g.161910 Transcript_108218/m.161910 type:complete len:958 (-) Transcript_108218:55-2928(-)
MAKSSTESDSAASSLLGWAWLGVAVYVIGVLIATAYDIRMGAIKEFGPVIHEFDPYFNFRATEYLYDHGATKFFQWFDHMSWYPLGRPVGTTIYPGMQFTAVWIKRYLLTDWSLNDVCCYIPAWFGAMASVLVGLMTYECTTPYNSSSTLLHWVWDLVQGQTTELTTHSKPIVLGLTSPAVECGIFSMAMMAIVPAHLMRSVGGGYDNESVAVTAMCLTFYLWMRSLRNDASAPLGALVALAYFNMVAAWGGYIFVVNLIGVHAAFLIGMGRFSKKLYTSYSLFYLIGTSLAIQIPVVGWAPLKSLEQLGPCAIFLGMQLLKMCEMIKGDKTMTRTEYLKLRVKVFAAAGIGGIVLIMAVAPSGYFGPLSSRVRGLFVQHTKTGNPLVDSVAEHQPASSKAYFQYLHHVCSLAPLGFLMAMGNLSDSSSFLLVWGSTAYFFSHRMVRLILLTAPIGSVLAGIAAGQIFSWCIRQWWEKVDDSATSSSSNGASSQSSDVPVTKKGGKPTKKGRKTSSNNSSSSSKNADSFEGLSSFKTAMDGALSSNEGVIAKRTVACLVLILGYVLGVNFTSYSWKIANDLWNPTIIVKARLRDGRVIKLDDYREAYWWLRDNTPEDSRIMAWWDYGYQITAIANRTTLADGNTWNHEHIALLGKALTASEEEGYQIARHLADYVLVWGGGGGDDLAKSPHLARIANSVYRDHCPQGDPTCRSFGFVDRQGTPSDMMERSLLYRLHGHQVKPGVEADPAKWKEVHRSKYGRVRIYKILDVDQESKAWVPKNRVCDVEGGWFCRGQYPPGLGDILASKTDFAQLEDFNRGKADEEYQKQYFEALNNPEKAKRIARQLELEKRKTDESAPKDETQRKAVDEIYNTWEDTEDTTLMWNLISNNQAEELRVWMEEEPTVAFIRSRDGRGPMWWAFEQRNEAITKMLMKAGVPHTDRDAKGMTPVDLLEGNA